MNPPADRKAAAADDLDWRARDGYPDVASSGPAFGVGRELEQGGWSLEEFFGASYPQEARDTMSHTFRVMAAGYPEDSPEHAECIRAAERLDREVIDEMTVLGTRYRVIRAEQFVRSGPNGPEPPRPSDSDPDRGNPQRTRDLTSRPTDGFVIDPVNGTTMSRGIFTLDLLNSVPQPGMASPEADADLQRTAQTHPGGVLLPTVFIIARLTRGRWGPLGSSTDSSPQAARDSLVHHLRVGVPYDLDLSDDQRVPYNAAADQVEDDHADEVTVAGKRFRVARLERLVRIGPDGPEGPRPSDPDPYPPALADGELPEEEPDDTPEDREPSEGNKRWRNLYAQETRRLDAKRGRAPKTAKSPKPAKAGEATKVPKPGKPGKPE